MIFAASLVGVCPALSVVGKIILRFLFIRIYDGALGLAFDVVLNANDDFVAICVRKKVLHGYEGKNSEAWRKSHVALLIAWHWWLVKMVFCQHFKNLSIPIRKSAPKKYTIIEYLGNKITNPNNNKTLIIDKNSTVNENATLSATVKLLITVFAAESARRKKLTETF